jgi:hypothetical protein
VKAGKIKAIRIGDNYAIPVEELGIGMAEPTTKEKTQVTEAVDKVFKEYGETIKKLGEE